jgi:hypothetical protein
VQGLALLALVSLLVGGVLFFSANANQSVTSYTKQVLKL